MSYGSIRESKRAKLMKIIKYHKFICVWCVSFACIISTSHSLSHSVARPCDNYPQRTTMCTTIILWEQFLWSHPEYFFPLILGIALSLVRMMSCCCVFSPKFWEILRFFMTLRWEFFIPGDNVLFYSGAWLWWGVRRLESGLRNFLCKGWEFNGLFVNLNF